MKLIKKQSGLGDVMVITIAILTSVVILAFGVEQTYALVNDHNAALHADAAAVDDAGSGTQFNFLAL